MPWQTNSHLSLEFKLKHCPKGTKVQAVRQGYKVNCNVEIASVTIEPPAGAQKHAAEVVLLLCQQLAQICQHGKGSAEAGSSLSGLLTGTLTQARQT